MKAFLAGFATAIFVVAVFVLWQGVRNGEWIFSFIKSPGLMALRDIQADIRLFQRQGHPHPALSRSTSRITQALTGAMDGPYEPPVPRS